MKTLLLFAHPAFEKSKVNKLMLDGLDQFSNLSIHNLYEAYPDFDIDIEKEQALLEAHDCIIFQFPLFWYSTPSIFKEWQDLVLKHSWAYGSKGHRLEGKLFINIVSLGGPKISYGRNELNKYTLEELLTPLELMSNVCRMIRLPHFGIYGTHVSKTPELMAYKRMYNELLRQLTEDDFELTSALGHKSLNTYLSEQNR